MTERKVEREKRRERKIGREREMGAKSRRWEWKAAVTRNEAASPSAPRCGPLRHYLAFTCNPDNGQIVSPPVVGG